MAKPKPEEIEKLKERIKALSDDERAAVVEALEPDIWKQIKALLAAAPPPAPPKEPDPPAPPKKPWWEIF